MSFINLQSKMAHYLRWVLWGILVVFVVTIFYWYQSPRDRQGRGGRGETAAIMVGDQAIAYEELRSLEDRIGQQFGYRLALAEYARAQAAYELVTRELLRRAVREGKIRVSRAEVEARADQMVEQDIQRQWPDRVALKSYLISRKISLDDLKKDVRGRLDMHEIEEQLAFEKLRRGATQKIRVSDQELEEQYTTVEVRIIAIPIEGQDEAEAKQKAEEAAKKAKEGVDFATLGKEYGSPESSRDAGKTTTVPLPVLPKELRAAIAALQPEQVAGPVPADKVYYVVQLVGKEVKPPEDFEENKENYRGQLLYGKQEDAWNEYLDSLRKKAKVKYLAPEVGAAVALSENRPDDALALFEKAAKEEEADLESVYFSMGSIHESKSDLPQAEVYYRKAADEGGSPEAYIALANVLDKAGKRPEALQALASASEAAEDDVYMHQQIRDLYERMGEKDLAAAQQRWLQEQEVPVEAPATEAPPENR